MVIDIVGYTGFVGSNLALSYNFDNYYNSKNIDTAYGTEPDILVYAGVTGTKYIANKFPQEDWKIIESAKTNIKKIAPKKLILISTIDVFEYPNNQNELSSPNSSDSFTYGFHRLLLEKWVKENVEDYIIIRLPGIYGENLKKNYIYDLINPIPQSLSKLKYEELVNKDSNLSNYYVMGIDGFYHPNIEATLNKDSLRCIFKRLEFSSLNFTDSRGIFQYYNLKWLWNHIKLAVNYNLKIVNIATEPFSVAELYKYINQKTFVNELNAPVPYYNFKTIYCDVLGGRDGYLYSKEEVLSDIKQFVNIHK